jgi:hypothetical protein
VPVARLRRWQPARRRERLWLDAVERDPLPPPPSPPRLRRDRFSPAPPRPQRDRFSPAARYVLDLCDDVVGEQGWRDHRFRWLASEGGDAALLPVDAYYPGPGLVIQYRERREGGDDERERLIPAHGLALVTVTPDVLGTNGSGRIARRPQRDRATLAELVGQAAAPRTARSARRERERAGPASRAWELQIAVLALALLAVGLGVLGGLVGGPQYWLDVGGALAAFGLAYDLYARVLGTLAARAAGEERWAWACALGGSPAVAAHAALRRSGPSRPELDTLLGLVVLTFVLALLVASLAGFGD